MKYVKFYENFNSLILYHGTPEEFEHLKTDSRLSGLYASTAIEVAKTYSGRNGSIYKLHPKKEIKIKDLSDGFDLLQYIIKEEIIDEIDDDLENYILGGRLFQYDIQSRTHYVDSIVNNVRYDGFDLVKIPDDLGGYGENVAYVILNMEKFNYEKIK